MTFRVSFAGKFARMGTVRAKGLPGAFARPGMLQIPGAGISGSLALPA